jgi:hypothetical protein
MKSSRINWQDDFPIHEEAEDFAGKPRRFLITCHEGGVGYTVRASEKDGEGLGYEFAAFSETSPHSALGRVREKMRRGLATRYLSGTPGQRQMLHDRLRGRITSNGGGGVILVVDGIQLGIDDLESILSTYEGWEFRLRIVDAHE